MSIKTVAAFREHFVFPSHFSPSTFSTWYPGHMAKGLRAVRAMINNCDCVIEVHDSRIPNVGRNPNFYDYVANKPRILMLTKADLVNKWAFKNYSEKLTDFGVTTFDCNSKEMKHRNIRKIVPRMLEIMQEQDRDLEHSEQRYTKSYRILVCGIPNTGKSSLINALRRTHCKKGGRATPIGKLPGVTKSLMNKILVNEDPKVYVFDTPGVVPPQIDDLEVGMKLAVVGTFPDHLVGEDYIADYLLYILNKQRKYAYVQKYGLPGPCDDFEIVSMFIARKTGFWEGNKPHYINTSSHFLRQFRKGELGKVFLGGKCNTHNP